MTRWTKPKGDPLSEQHVTWPTGLGFRNLRLFPKGAGRLAPQTVPADNPVDPRLRPRAARRFTRRRGGRTVATLPTPVACTVIRSVRPWVELNTHVTNVAEVFRHGQASPPRNPHVP